METQRPPGDSPAGSGAGTEGDWPATADVSTATGAGVSRGAATYHGRVPVVMRSPNCLSPQARPLSRLRFGTQC